MFAASLRIHRDIKFIAPLISPAPRLQLPMNRAYRLVFPAALTFAHLARAAAASLALTAGLLRRSRFFRVFGAIAVSFTLAHLAFAAALMAALPAALIRRLPFLALVGADVSPLSPVMVASSP